MDETILDKMLLMLYDHGIPYKHVNHDDSIYKKALDKACVLGFAEGMLDGHIVTYSLTADGIERVEAKMRFMQPSVISASAPAEEE